VTATPPGPPTWLGTTARDALDEIDEDLAPVSAVPLPTLMAGALDTGYVDPDELRRCIDVARGADRIPSQLADTLTVEIGLRSLVGNPPPAER
jgi:hypothetical protein